MASSVTSTSTSFATVTPATVPAGCVNVDAVNLYRAADAKGKANLRSAFTSQIKATIMQAMTGDASANQRGLDLIATEAACLTKAPKAPKTVNAGLVIANRIAALRMAADLLERGEFAPKDLTLPVGFIGPNAFDFAEVDATEVWEAASAIAGSKITKSSERRVVQSVVDRAFADLPEGAFLTSAEIAEAGKIEGYKCSGGAISARLVPMTYTDGKGTVSGKSCTFTGVRVQSAGTAGLGAIKDSTVTGDEE